MTTYDVEIVVPEDCGIKAAGETVTLEVDGSEYVLAAARAPARGSPRTASRGGVRPVLANSSRARSTRPTPAGTTTWTEMRG